MGYERALETGRPMEPVAVLKTATQDWEGEAGPNHQAPSSVSVSLATQAMGMQMASELENDDVYLEDVWKGWI